MIAMQKLLSILWIPYCIYAFAVFVGGLFLVTPGIIIAMLLSQPLGGNLVIHLSRIWSHLWFALIGIWHINIWEEPLDRKRHFVFVANHISYLDIPLIFQALRHTNIRVLGKYEMAKIPVFGILYRLAVVLVDRSSPERRARSVAMLKEVLAHNRSIFIFPEGTFNETGAPLKSFYDGAFRIAIETNTAIKPIVFLDAKTRMHYASIWRLRPGKSRAVILKEVPTEGLTMEDLPLLKKRVYDLMESTIIDYNNRDAQQR